MAASSVWLLLLGLTMALAVTTYPSQYPTEGNTACSDTGCYTSWLGDQYCDTVCNNEACGWDGGDCESSSTAPTQAPTYQDASSAACVSETLCVSESWIADGTCDADCYNSQCNWDGGDCEGSSAQVETDTCLVSGCPYRSWLGDGYCDTNCYTAECDWDGGDCAASTSTTTTGTDGTSTAQTYCTAHSDCGAEFCSIHTGFCSSCDSCTVCSDGIDGTCGSCDSTVYPVMYPGTVCQAVDASVITCLSSGCPFESWVGNGQCDASCNTEACQWDGGDCASTPSPSPATYECPATTPIMCSDGTCMLAAADCADTSITMSPSSSTSACPTATPVMCSDGTCMVAAADCSHTPMYQTYSPTTFPTQAGCSSTQEASCLATGCHAFNHIGDNYCDDSCFNAECCWDGGDCETRYGQLCLDSGCPLLAWRGDGVCDASCNIAVCEFDRGDCAASACPATTPIMCADGACVLAAADCSTHGWSVYPTLSPTEGTSESISSSVTIAGFDSVDSFTEVHQDAFKAALVATLMVPGLDPSQIELVITLARRRASVERTRRLASGQVLVTYTIVGLSSDEADSAQSTADNINVDTAAANSFTNSLSSQMTAVGATVPADLGITSLSDSSTSFPTPQPTAFPTTPRPTSTPTRGPTKFPTHSPTKPNLCTSGEMKNEFGECVACDLGHYQDDVAHDQTACKRCPGGSFANETGLATCYQCPDEICWVTKEGVQEQIAVLGQLSGAFVLTIIDWPSLTNYHGFDRHESGGYRNGNPTYRLQGVKMPEDTTNKDFGGVDSMPGGWDDFFSANREGCMFNIVADDGQVDEHATVEERDKSIVRFVKSTTISDITGTACATTTSPADMEIKGQQGQRATWYFRVIAEFAGNTKRGEAATLSYSHVLTDVVADPSKAEVISYRSTPSIVDPGTHVEIAFVTAANPPVDFQWLKDDQQIQAGGAQSQGSSRRRLVSDESPDDLQFQECETSAPGSGGQVPGRRWLAARGKRGRRLSAGGTCATPDFFTDKDRALVPDGSALQLFSMNFTRLQRKDTGSYKLVLSNYKGTTIAHTVKINVACTTCEDCVPNSHSTSAESPCVCNDGYYWEYSDPAAAKPPHKLGFQCTPCPLGGICKDNTKVQGIITNTSYFRVNETDHRFYKCNKKPKGACPMASIDNQCSNTTTGILCHRCIDEPVNHFLEIDTCVPCPKLNYDPRAFAQGLFVISLIVIVYAVSELLRRPIQIKDEQFDGVSATTVATVAHNQTASTAVIGRSAAMVASGQQESSESRSAEDVGGNLADAAEANSSANEDRSAADDAEQLNEAFEQSANEERSAADDADQLNEAFEQQGTELDAGGEGAAPQMAVLKQGFSSTAALAVERLKITVTWAQCLGPFIFTFEIPWPQSFFDQLLFLNNIFSVDFMGLMANVGAAACEIDTGFYSSFILHLLMLPALGAVFFLAYVVARFRGQKPFTKQRAKGKHYLADVAGSMKTRAVQAFLFVLFLVYPSLCAKTFRVFKCSQYSNDWYLDADLSVKCFGEEHNQYLVVGGIGIAVFAIGIPVVLLLILFRMRHQIALMDLKLEHGTPLSNSERMSRARWGHVYEAYNPDDWYFEIVEMSRKMILTGGLVLIEPGSSVQILLGIITCAAYLCVMINSQPFRSTADNVLCQMTAWQLFATLLIGLWITTAKYAKELGGDAAESNPYDDNIAAAILLVLYFFTACVLLIMFVVALQTFVYKSKEVIHKAADHLHLHKSHADATPVKLTDIEAHLDGGVHLEERYPPSQTTDADGEKNKTVKMAKKKSQPPPSSSEHAAAKEGSKLDITVINC